MAERVLSVDLGGTNMRAALVDADGSISGREVRPTPRDQPRPDALVQLMKDVSASSGAARAVVGVPGRVDHREGRLDHAPNLVPTWAAHLTEARLSDAVGLPVALANDADLAAVGEAYFGAGRDYSDIVYVTMSTGVGAGVLLGRKLVCGRRSCVEAGHAVIDRTAWAAGKPSSFEQLASGTAMARIAAELELNAKGAEVARLVESGDARAREVWARVCEAAAIGVRNLCFLFTPEAVVVGGGLGLTGDLLYRPIREHLATQGPPALPEPIAVVRAALGDQAGLAGAAGWHLAFDPRAAGR